MQETNFPAPVPFSQLSAGPSIEWSWQGYLAPQYLTLISGQPKVGKSTLLAHVLLAMATGGDIGGQIQPGRVLLISEEAPGLWARRRDALRIGDHADCLCRPLLTRPSAKDWLRFTTHLAQLTTAKGYQVVVLDTFASLSPTTDENNSVEMMAALKPLHAVTEAGAAVLLLHHLRKSDGLEGTAARGSGALVGFVDIICELRRFNVGQFEDTRRVITAFSRFDETPPEAVLDLTDSGYQSCGTRQDADRQARLEAIQRLLPEEPPGMTADEVHESWPEGNVKRPGKRQLHADLKYAADGSRWKVTGEGRKGDPFRYHTTKSS